MLQARAEQMKANRGGRGGGRGRAPGKWTAAAPSEEYRQSLFGAGAHRRSTGVVLPVALLTSSCTLRPAASLCMQHRLCK